MSKTKPFFLPHCVSDVFPFKIPMLETIPVATMSKLWPPKGVHVIKWLVGVDFSSPAFFLQPFLLPS